MSRYDDLVHRIRDRGSFLCVGLDPDRARLPQHLGTEPQAILDFCETIIQHTAEYAVSYKINLAFFEVLGSRSMELFAAVREMIPSDCLLIADAKRGDIGNSSRMYAETFFDTYQCDAVTVAPYMGKDSVQAFLDHQDHWTVLLALTSNSGSQDFQRLSLQAGGQVYEQVLHQSMRWADKSQLMYVVGATHPEMFQQLRNIIGDRFLLVPGVGAQGGTVAEVCAHGLTDDVGLLINSSRSIIYASSSADFGEAAAAAARDLRDQMRDVAASQLLRR